MTVYFQSHSKDDTYVTVSYIVLATLHCPVLTDCMMGIDGRHLYCHPSHLLEYKWWSCPPLDVRRSDYWMTSER